jgi:hypothetical protein
MNATINDCKIESSQTELSTVRKNSTFYETADNDLNFGKMAQLSLDSHQHSLIDPKQVGDVQSYIEKAIDSFSESETKETDKTPSPINQIDTIFRDERSALNEARLIIDKTRQRIAKLPSFSTVLGPPVNTCIHVEKSDPPSLIYEWDARPGSNTKKYYPDYISKRTHEPMPYVPEYTGPAMKSDDLVVIAANIGSKATAQGDCTLE